MDPSDQKPAGAPEPERPVEATGPAPAPQIPAEPVAQPDIAWTAAEFVAHDKSFRWYALLLLGGFVVAGLDYLIAGDVFSTAVIVFATVVFAIFAARKPHTQSYALTRDGIQIGGRLYSFTDFKTFSVNEEAGVSSVILMPLRRFMPALTIHLSEDVEDAVADRLSEILPFEAHKADAVDSLLKRMRF